VIGTGPIRLMKSRKTRWSGRVACIINTCRIMVGNPEGKRPLGRPKRKGITLKLIVNEYTLPQLIQLIAAAPPRWPGFDSRARYLEFVLEELALERVFSEYLGFPCQFSFHQLLHTH
jgi:hypothetical protein